MKLAFSKELTIFTITIVFNFFSPTFGQWEKYIIDNTLNKPEVVAIGDLNGDTKLDVVVNDLSDNKIICYENNYPNWIKHNIDSNLEGAYVPDIGDLDGDGDLDVVASGYRQGGDLVWYENNHPIWTKHMIRSDYATEWSWVGDVDGDGAIDVAVVRWYEGEVNWFRNENAGQSWTEFSIDDNLDQASHLYIGDIDGDSDLDIAAAGASGDVIVWYENKHMTWFKHTIDHNLGSAWCVVVVDIDGDEKPDVAATGRDPGKVVWYKNNHPEWEKQIIDANLKGANLLLSADIDNDNALDIVVPQVVAGNLVWYKNPTDMVWSKSTEINSNYIKPNRDTLILNSSMVNPENHQASVFARLKSETGSIKDSIQLFDDGLQNDAEASDNLWGGISLLSDFEEGMFRMDLFINDLTTGTSYVHPEVSLFTTAGPIQIDGYEILQVNDSLIGITELELQNIGASKEIYAVTAKLITSDSNNIVITHPNAIFGRIPPGESRKTNSNLAFVLKNSTSTFEFELEISSSDIAYWKDTLTFTIVDVEDRNELPKQYALQQNYPNPFNPSTTIKYSIPSSSVISNPQRGERSHNFNMGISPFGRNDNVHVYLKVYDILGRQVAILVNEKQRPGNYEVEFDASTSSATGKELTSGIYFYQLTAGQFVETKKLVVLK